MKKSAKIIRAQNAVPDTEIPLPREDYIRVPQALREGFRQVALKMRSIPPKKAGTTFDLAVRMWKPVAFALRMDFERQQRARELPHNMQFTDYFLKFQLASDREYEMKRAPGKPARRSAPRKKKQTRARPPRRRRK